MPSTRRASAQHSTDPASDNAAATTKTASGSRSASTKPAAADSASAGAVTAVSEDEASTDAHIELLTEHFGFSPKVFVEALVYLSNEHLYQLAEQFEVAALDQLQDLEGGDLEAEQGVHAVLTLLENALDHTLDTFELYCLRSVFGIKARQAKLMTLDHHRGLDLRSGGLSAGPPKSSKARKSLAATSASVTASERSHTLGAEEDALKRKLAAARSVQHDLLKGKQAAQARLTRIELLQRRFSAILAGAGGDRDDGKAHPDAGPAVTAVLGQHARKLCMDAEMLLRNLEQLRKEDPLGRPLLPAAANAASGRGADDDEADSGQRAWERGREAYLNWEAERMVAKVKGAADGFPTNAAAVDEPTIFADDGNATTAGDDGKTPKRRKAAATAPSSTKRKANATPGGSRKRQPVESSSVDVVGDADVAASARALGEAADVDKVAAALRR